MDIITILYHTDLMAKRPIVNKIPPTDILSPFLPIFSEPEQLTREPNPEDPDQISRADRAVIEGIVEEGLTVKEAGIAAGYLSEQTVVNHLRTPQVRSALLTALDQAGIDEAYLTTKLGIGLEALRSVYHQGIVVGVEVDHNARHKYLTTLLELRGDTTKKVESAGDSWEEVLFQIRARRSVK